MTEALSWALLRRISRSTVAGVVGAAGRVIDFGVNSFIVIITELLHETIRNYSFLNYAMAPGEYAKGAKNPQIRGDLHKSPGGI